ncbi:MAG TPA: MarR family transcriptional regulator [Candidatus Marinimicrobia bacterium]|nr:MarR family transcriptional regulator [Candidatus Neomarinimicrobiota bacterium]
MSDIENKILSAFEKAGKPLKAGEVAEITGLTKDEVAKVIAGLKKQGKVESPKACYYQVKKS